MACITRNFKWLMLLSGVLTATMFYGLFAPQAALVSMFGTSFDGELQSIIVRSWSALIGLIGIMLIYGALVEKNRAFAAFIGALSKAIFVSLVLIYGQAFWASAAPAVIMDIVIILLTLVYLLALKVTRSAA